MPDIFITTSQENRPVSLVVSPAGVRGPVGPEYTLTQQKLNDTIELNPAATRNSLELGTIATRDSVEFQPAGSYVLSTDPRLSDNRDPNPHTHSWDDIEEPIHIITFDTTNGGPLSTGQIGWNSAAESLVVKGVNNTDLELAEKLVYHVQNNSGSNISKGSPVSYAGTTGNSGKELIKLWNGSTDAVELFMGLAASDIPNGSTGYVVHFGKLRGINTNDFPSGAILYANPTGAGLTSTKPTVDHVVVAACINSANNGTLSIRPNIQLVTHWDDVVDKPTQFNPTAHGHGNITSDGRIGTLSGRVLTTTTNGAITTLPRNGIDSRTEFPPSAHSHGNITADGKIGTSNNRIIVTGVDGGLFESFELTNGLQVDAGVVSIQYGTTANTVCEGNDARLSDSRTPLAHTHGNITNDGRIGTVSNRVVTTTTNGALTTLSRDSIDSRTSFPNNDVTNASEFTGASTLVRRSSTGSASFTAVNVAQTNGLVFFGINPVTITANATAARLLTLPDTTGTLAVAATNAQTFLSTPSSATLAVALGDASGTSGGFVRATGATLTTPVINNPTVQGYVENTNTVAASGSAQTISIANSTFQAFTLTANCTFTLPTAVNGQSFTLIVYSNTGAFTTSFVAPAGSSISWANQIVPLGTNIANRADLYSFVAHGTRWFASQSPNHSA